jgi:hypothetical protein
MGKEVFSAPFVIVDTPMKSDVVFGTSIILKNNFVIDTKGNDLWYIRYGGKSEKIVDVVLKGKVHPLDTATKQTDLAAIAPTIPDVQLSTNKVVKNSKMKKK